MGKLQIHRPKGSDKTPFQPVTRPFAPASAVRRTVQTPAAASEVAPQHAARGPQTSAAVPSGSSVGELTLQTKGDGAGSGEKASALSGTNARSTVIQRVDVAGIDVENDNGYPKWTQNEKTYHITMLATDSMHVTEEYSRQHYHFAVDAGTVTSKRPKKSEVGGRFKDHHKLDQIPDSEVYDFIVNNITAILAVE